MGRKEKPSCQEGFVGARTGKAVKWKGGSVRGDLTVWTDVGSSSLVSGKGGVEKGSRR